MTNILGRREYVAQGFKLWAIQVVRQPSAHWFVQEDDFFERMEPKDAKVLVVDDISIPIFIVI
jgi:hypothetical protein